MIIGYHSKLVYYKFFEVSSSPQIAYRQINLSEWNIVLDRQ